MDFLTGFILGAFLVESTNLYWYRFGGAERFASWRQRQIDRLRDRV